jgi:hypothetical protein
MRPYIHEENEPWSAAEADAERQTKALAGLAFLLALAIIGFYLIVHLRAVGKIEDCLLAQHSNCDSLIGAP